MAMAELVAWLAIMLNYTIPNASLFLRILITPPKFASIFSAVGLTYLALYSTDATFYGLDVIMLLTIFFVSQLFIRWILTIAIVARHLLRNREVK
jgi:hypothetical protein